MTSEGLEEMFEGDSADMCAGKFPLVSVGGRTEGLAHADPGGEEGLRLDSHFNLFIKKRQNNYRYISVYP